MSAKKQYPQSVQVTNKFLKMQENRNEFEICKRHLQNMERTYSKEYLTLVVNYLYPANEKVNGLFKVKSKADKGN